MADATRLAFDHVYYWTRDMDRAVAFYEGTLGLELVHRSGDGWAEFRAGPVKLALHGIEGDDLPAGGTTSTPPDGLCSNAGWPSTATRRRSPGSAGSTPSTIPTAIRCS
jgi:catechol 2,3-dioxygenase-like lactoylglutathione lyase family enzyme